MPTAPDTPTAPRRLAPAPGAAVAVLGEMLVDRFADGRQVAGGAPFNVARWLAAFGVETLFISRIGQGDEAGAMLRQEMRRAGLSEAGLQIDAAHATGLVHVRPDPAGHRFEIVADSAWDHIDAAAALPLLQAFAPGVVYFGTLALRSAPNRAALAALVQATPALRFADLNLRPVDGLRALAEQAMTLADWVKVNDDELQTLLAWFVTAGAPAPIPSSPAHEQACQVLCRQFELQRLVVTQGAQGWYALDAQGCCDARGPAVPVPAVQDTVGAGDAFAATLLAACIHGHALTPALQAAARLGAAACTWPGALPADTQLITHWRAALGLAAPPAAVTPTAPGARIETR